ncbi:beta-1 adrenergic receptor-like [Physella acuta]|uniref:beta-1 adrenergic receptor-like n=1 Tax=Physella acuta TaxID=109671 RepID=UPI0027DD2005|nr:beta-1 adrenergic receptor-like [Physella acuta]
MSDNSTLATLVTQATTEDPTKVTFIDAVIVFLCISLSVLISAVNALTIVVIRATPSLRTLTNAYVVSLAAADLIVGISLTPTGLFFLPPTRYSLFFRFVNLCLLINAINIGMAGTSFVHLAMVSIDRYLYISKPFIYEKYMTVNVALGFIILCWITGAVYVFLPQIFHNPYGAVPVCSPTILFPEWYMFYGAWVAFFLCAAVIFTMCYLIIRTAVKQRNAIRATDTTGNSNTTVGISRSTMKTLKYFFTVFGVFFVCITPTVLCMGLDYYIRVPAFVFNAFAMLALTNSGMNFIILTVQNKGFRRSMFKMLSCYVCFDSWKENLNSLSPTHV